MQIRAASQTYLTERALALSERNEKELSLCEDDPLSCSAEMRRHLEWTQTNWRIEIDSRIRVSCTEETFVIEIDLQVQHEGSLVFTRCWREEVPRILG